MIVVKSEPHNALEIDSIGPFIFVEYTDADHNTIRYVDPRTRIYGKASVANVKRIDV